MTFEQSLQSRLRELASEGILLRDSEGSGVSGPMHYQQCVGWMVALRHLMNLVSDQTVYADELEELFDKERGAHIASTVGEACEILRHFIADMEAGLLGSVADRARAETFDTFLDHGKAYLEDGRKQEAGVIVGVVFEDAVRRICRKHSITEQDVKLDTLISALVKAKVITELKAKRARVAAHVRTKATHAQWDEFTDSDVTEALAFTRELLDRQLDA
jgi:hypothetical protein